MVINGPPREPPAPTGWEPLPAARLFRSLYRPGHPTVVLPRPQPRILPDTIRPASFSYQGVSRRAATSINLLRREMRGPTSLASLTAAQFSAQEARRHVWGEFS
ncbi:Hypothetical protein NTJ_06424 [Nesidiocoris tenuis]|uniref:Uncharacterized protein n=1 Tax=Nesidiocoris tenuis TaxID=355587 RepID=A0ABN7ARS1_9HEMI|nr:Hypothetical protein NTJ_06424 [Nesidiocoris tenuis]